MKISLIQPHLNPSGCGLKINFKLQFLATLLILSIAGCANQPPPPDWKMNAYQSAERAVEAYLRGDSRIEGAEFVKVKREIMRTGRLDTMARAELMRCASRVAALDFEPCTAFEGLKQDAQAPEKAYNDYLNGVLKAEDIVLLPLAHQPLARQPAAFKKLAEIQDPLTKLVAAAVLLRTQKASPEVIEIAVDTASAQGWRRPLLAWLNIQLQAAENNSDSQKAQHIQRRIALLLGD